MAPTCAIELDIVRRIFHTPLMRMILYGIPNCDTVKRARLWLQQHGRDVRFHDFKKAGVPSERLDAWVEALGWERLLNRRGTAWHKLDDTLRAGVTDAQSAKRAMLAHPSVIKRPVVEWTGGAITVGFSAADWACR
jgi:Spx/MgsR family transcriptional regulator